MLTVSFPGISLPVKTRDYKQLEKAYREYLLKPDNYSAQFGLEAAYWKCYRKEAPARLIDKLAKMPWGPFKAWEVFGKTSLAVIGYDHSKNRVYGGWGYRHPKGWQMFSSLSMPVLFLMAALLIVIGMVALGKVFVMWSQMTFNASASSEMNLILFTFIFGVVGLAGIGVGGNGLRVAYLGTRSSSYDAYAYRLKHHLETQYAS